MVKISCTKGSYKLCVVQMDIWFNLIHDSVSRLYVKDSHYFCLSGNIQTSTAWLGPLLQLQSRCWPLHCIWKGSSFQAPFSCWPHSFPCQLPAGGALSFLAVALVSGHLASSIFKSKQHVDSFFCFESLWLILPLARVTSLPLKAHGIRSGPLK